MRAGVLLLAAGAALALPQVFTVTPWQGGFALGVLLMLAGGLRLSDHATQ